VRRAIAIRNKAEEKLARGEKLTLSDFDASHSNGRAISEENKQTVRDYWLKNTRMSPNQSDSVFVRNPATGKKDLKVQVQWREETYFQLMRRCIAEVSACDTRATPWNHNRVSGSHSETEVCHLCITYWVGCVMGAYRRQVLKWV
jgi:hypothetical protein